MANYQTKSTQITAVQYDGTNGNEVANLVGSRQLDLKGDYVVPNFVDATKWISWATDGQWAVWTGGNWQVINETQWIVCLSNEIIVMNDSDFTQVYEPITPAVDVPPADPPVDPAPADNPTDESEPTEDEPPLDTMTVVQLHEVAAKRGVTGVSHLKKSDLIAALSNGK